jgi:hypothetical protein
MSTEQTTDQFSVTLTLDGIEATDPVAAARQVAAMLAERRNGEDGYAWRGYYDVTGRETFTTHVDLEERGSGRRCFSCGFVDTYDPDENHGPIMDGHCPTCGAVLEVPHAHTWQTSRFTGTKTCLECRLLPLDEEDTTSNCTGRRS